MYLKPKRPRKYIFLSLVFLIPLICSAQTVKPDLWYPNGNYNGNLDKNQITILDFWFSNCGPCIYTLPHMNRLAEKFGNQANFVSVTFDSPAKVKKFMNDRDIIGHIAIDSSQTIINELNIHGFPTIVILDKKGNPIWFGHPNKLDESQLYQWLNPVITNNQYSSQGDKLKSEKYLISFDLNENNYSEAKSSGHRQQYNVFDYVNLTVPEMVSKLLGISTVRIESPITHSKKYDLHVKFRPDSNKVEAFSINKNLVLNQLLKMTDLNLKEKKKRCGVYVLKIKNDSLLFANGLDSTRIHYGPGSSVYEDYIEGSSLTLNDLSSLLETHLNQIILTDNYLPAFFKIRFPASDFEEINTYLENKYGLILEPEVREVEIIQLSENDL